MMNCWQKKLNVLVKTIVDKSVVKEAVIDLQVMNLFDLFKVPLCNGSGPTAKLLAPALQSRAP